MLTRVGVHYGSALTTDPPRAWFRVNIMGWTDRENYNGTTNGYDVTADAQRVLVNTAREGRPSIRVVFNWPATLPRR